MARHWTAEELLLFEELYEKMPLNELAEQLGRAPKTLVNRAKMMGLGSPPEIGSDVRQYVQLLEDRARKEGRAQFLTDRGGDLVLIAATEFRPYPGVRIAYVVWPPKWRYRPKG